MQSMQYYVVIWHAVISIKQRRYFILLSQEVSDSVHTLPAETRLRSWLEHVPVHTAEPKTTLWSAQWRSDWWRCLCQANCLD